MTSVWHALDHRLGVPVVFAIRGDRVVTNAPQVAAQRGEGALTTATIDLVDGLGECFHLRAECDEGGLVTVDLTESDAWLGGILTAESTPTIRSRFLAQHPTLRTPTGIVTWDEGLATLGSDAATWAVLRSASKAAPVVLGVDLVTLSTRADANPLALVRRAHAACVIREEYDPTDSTRAAGQFVDAPPDDDGPLRFAILAASRALHDAERQERTRPALLAVEHLAREALRHLERTPVTRTDLPAVHAARSILRTTMDAVGVAAPVPY